MPRISLLNLYNNTTLRSVALDSMDGASYADVCGACYRYYKLQGSEDHKPYSGMQPQMSCDICGFTLGFEPEDD